MPAVQFIYFDLDDTLLDHRQAERNGLADVCQAFPEHFTDVDLATVQDTYHAHSVPLWKAYANGDIDKTTLQRLRFEHTLTTLGIDGLEPNHLNTLYLDCYARHWTLPEPARQAFHTLADHYPVGILTNGFAEVQRAKFNRFPELRERAEAIVISEEVGTMKPHRQIFDHAAGLAGVSPEAILYVGDSFSSDVQGALDAGWQMAWYTPRDSVEAPVFWFDQWDRLTAWLLGNAAS